MKALKKILPLLLAVAMLLALGTTAFAADGTNPGSITVNNAVKDKTYEIYRIFDVTMSGEGETAAYAYTINSDWTRFFFNEDGTKTSAGSTYLLDAQPEGGSLSQLVYNGKTYYINITESNKNTFTNAAHAYSKDLTPVASKTATGTTVEFTDLPLGYYLVLPVDATELLETTSSICSLTLTKPNATVSPKATYPTVEKDVDDNDVEVGQTVTFTVTVPVPDVTGYDHFWYKLTDTMSAGLSFGNSYTLTNFTAKIVDGENETVIINGSGESEIYNLSEGTGEGARGEYLTFANNGFTLWLDIYYWAKQAGTTSGELVITYDAVVNKDAIVSVTANDVHLDYGHDPEHLQDGGNDKEYVYSSEIVVIKYDGATENAEEKTYLAGATFVLYKMDGENKLYYKADESGNVTWVTSEDAATKLTTGEDGKVAFGGLESGSYFLHETKAPDGFNLLTEDVEVTVTAPAETEQHEPIGVRVEKPIANNSGSTLPETGGIGTTIFYIVGAALLLGAGVFLFVRKRVGDEG